jgi:hypothetical protein
MARLERTSVMDGLVDIDALIDALIDREGGYANRAADKGGPTCFGITEAVARAQGYAGPMRQLPRADAAAIYRRIYWLRPRLDEVAKRSQRVAAELFDTGVNMGPAVAITFLQSAHRAQPQCVGLSRPDAGWPRRPGYARRARRISRPPWSKQRRNCVAARARGAPGRALPPPRRTPAGQRSVPLWLAGEPNW